MALISFDLQVNLGDNRFDFKADLDRDITAVMGESGSGKTTLCMLLAGFLKPNSGHLSVRNRVLVDTRRNIDVPCHQRKIGLVFQNHRLFPHLSVRDNILYPSKWGGRRSPDNLQEIIDILGLAPLMDRKPSELSGGQAQRTAIARGIVAAEELLIFDEPLSSLDRALRQETLSYLAKIPKLLDVPFLYITHQLDEALFLSDNGLFIEEGSIVRQGSCREIFQ